MDLPGMERQLARNQDIWEAEYNKFVNELFVFVNKCNIASMGKFVTDFCISNT